MTSIYGKLEIDIKVLKKILDSTYKQEFHNWNVVILGRNEKQMLP